MTQIREKFTAPWWTDLNLDLEKRGYKLGERNPATLPSAGVDRESVHENERNSRKLRGTNSPLVFANRIGGKYI